MMKVNGICSHDVDLEGGVIKTRLILGLEQNDSASSMSLNFSWLQPVMLCIKQVSAISFLFWVNSPGEQLYIFASAAGLRHWESSWKTCCSEVKCLASGLKSSVWPLWTLPHQRKLILIIISKPHDMVTSKINIFSVSFFHRDPLSSIFQSLILSSINVCDKRTGQGYEKYFLSAVWFVRRHCPKGRFGLPSCTRPIDYPPSWCGLYGISHSLVLLQHDRSTNKNWWNQIKMTAKSWGGCRLVILSDMLIPSA